METVEIVAKDGDEQSVSAGNTIAKVRIRNDVSDEDLANYKAQCEKLGGHYNEEEKSFVFDKDFNGYHQNTIARVFAGEAFETISAQARTEWTFAGYIDEKDKLRRNELQEGFMRYDLRGDIHEKEDFRWLHDPNIKSGQLNFRYNRQETERIQSVKRIRGLHPN